MAKPILNATLRYREDLNDTLSIFRFELEGGVPDYEPGQFITLGLPASPGDEKVVWRAYSIASPPSRKDLLELYIRMPLSPMPGKFTSALWALPIGGTLKHRGVTGPFTIESTRPDGTPDTRRLLLIGGGTGLAPFVACALELKKRNTPRELVILHGASYLEELAYRDLLLDLEEQTRLAPLGAFRVRYVPSISRPNDPKNAGWKGETGRIESLLLPTGASRPSRIEQILGTEITPEAFFCHVCGYEGTVKASLAVLEPRGFRTFRNKREDGSFDVKVESYG